MSRETNTNDSVEIVRGKGMLEYCTTLYVLICIENITNNQRNILSSQERVAMDDHIEVE